MPSVNIVVTGPAGAGKTTLIRTLSDVTVVSTDRDVSDHTRGSVRASGPVDFGRIALEPALVLYLFGTANDQSFDSTRDMLAEGMIGSILVVDGSREGSFDEAAKFVRELQVSGSGGLVVAVNQHNGDNSQLDIAYLRERLNVNEGVPVMPVDAADREGVKGAVLALLHLALQRLEGNLITQSA